MRVLHLWQRRGGTSNDARARTTGEETATEACQQTQTAIELRSRNNVDHHGIASRAMCGNACVVTVDLGHHTVRAVLGQLTPALLPKLAWSFFRDPPDGALRWWFNQPDSEYATKSPLPIL
jgi:hypothetical protein